MTAGLDPAVSPLLRIPARDVTSQRPFWHRPDPLVAVTRIDPGHALLKRHFPGSWRYLVRAKTLIDAIASLEAPAAVPEIMHRRRITPLLTAAAQELAQFGEAEDAGPNRAAGAQARAAAHRLSLFEVIMTITRRRSRRRITALLAAFALAVSLAALTAGPAQAERENFVGMAAAPDGGGYWLTASDGTIDAFGDAGFFGSAHDAVTQKSLGGVVGIARTPDGRGYWLATSGNSGGATVFTFGDAGFFGQPLSLGFGQVVGITATPDGRGYWLAENNDTIKTFGDAGFFGDGRS